MPPFKNQAAVPREFDGMFEDPQVNPYPEFEAEVFEMYFAQGIKVQDLRGREALDYAAWIEDFSDKLD